MKRTTKRILVLMLCTVLLFTSAHSIYSSTFTLEVQAAEVVITAEVAAAVIEYLWGLLLTAGLVTTAASWFDRVSQIDTALGALSAYPEITADMTLNVNVNGKELEVTYDQYMMYLRDHVVDETGAVQTNHEVFEVLSGGGGGKKNGDKDHLVRFTFGSALGYVFYKTVMTRGQISKTDGLTDDELAYINSACNDLLGVSNYVITDASQVYYRSTLLNYTSTGTDFQRPLSAEVYLNFDVEKTWDGTIGSNSTRGLYFTGENGTYGVRQEFTASDMNYGLRVVALVPSSTGSIHGSSNGVSYDYEYGQSFSVVLIDFYRDSSSGNAANNFNNFSFVDYSAVEVCTGSVTGGYGNFTLLNEDGNIVARHGCDYITKETMLRDGFAFSARCHSVNTFFDIQEGTNNLDLSIWSEDGAALPLLVVGSVNDLVYTCDSLLNHWNNSVFANYSGNTGEGIFTLPAYSQISDNALLELADAILHGNAGTDAVIEAAEAVDALREVEIPRLPEFYPDLYPEYLPQADPAEYPDLYPDYDPVTNPNPAPVRLPNPDRVVIDVTQAITDPVPLPNPNPNPNPNPDEDLEWDPSDWDLDDISFDLADYFPFCIPFDLIHAFKLLTAEAQAPYWEVPIHAEFLGFVIDYTFVIDFAQFEPLARIFRICETIGFCVGLILITRNIIRG
ncbi:MAG: hypothetical protein NC409_11470 [Clostridium sp.]|nr:hypothetical protein [Clostridium sp.]